MTQIADIKIKISGGGDVQNVLGAVRKGTIDARDAQLALKAAILETSRAKDEEAKKTGAAAKDAIKDVRLVIDAQRLQAQQAAEAARAQREQARQEAAAQRAIAKQMRENTQRANEFANAVKGITQHAIEAGGAVSRMAGVQDFSEMKKGADTVDELLARARISMGKTKEEWEAMGAKKIFFEVADKSGKSIEEVIGDFTKMQNETSRGGEMLANGGSLYREQAKFAQVTGGKIGDTSIAMTKFAEQYGLTPEEQARMPGALIMQQMQGSLEANTSQKFVKVASAHRALTGKSGEGGFMELLALGNTIKDLKGDMGESGAASTATYLNNLVNDLRKKKPGKELGKMVGHGVYDNEGHLDIIALAQELSETKSKMGDKKFGERLSKALPNSRSRMAMEKIIQSVETYKPSDPKSIQALANPDTAKGKDLIASGASDLLDTQNIKAERQRTKEIEAAGKGAGGINGLLNSVREQWGMYKANHLGVSMALDTNLPQMGIGYAAYKGAQKLAPKAMPWLARLLGLGKNVAASTVGSLATVAMMQGDNANLKPQSADEARQGDIAGTQAALNMWQGIRNKRAAGGGSKWGDGTGFSSDEEVAKTIKSLQETLERLTGGNKMQPQINLVLQISAPGIEARVVPEAKSSAQLAQTGPAKPVSPGRK